MFYSLQQRHLWNHLQSPASVLLMRLINTEHPERFGILPVPMKWRYHKFCVITICYTWYIVWTYVHVTKICMVRSSWPTVYVSVITATVPHVTEPICVTVQGVTSLRCSYKALVRHTSYNSNERVVSVLGAGSPRQHRRTDLPPEMADLTNLVGFLLHRN